MTHRNYQTNEDAAAAVVEHMKAAHAMEPPTPEGAKILILALRAPALVEALTALAPAIIKAFAGPPDATEWRDVPEELRGVFVTATTAAELVAAPEFEGVLATAVWLVGCVPQTKDIRIPNAIARVRVIDRLIISSFKTTRAYARWTISQREVSGRPLVKMTARLFSTTSSPATELRHFMHEFDKPESSEALNLKIVRAAQKMRWQMAADGFDLEFERVDPLAADFASALGLAVQ